MQPRPSHPTHSQISTFFSTFLPPATNDVPFHYHIPLHPSYNPSVTPIHHLILGLKPSPTSASFLFQPNTTAFLHRPFGLDRRRIRRGNLVLASHSAFDSALTVGYNTRLASRLGLDIPNTVCVQGYKGDPSRKIGILGRLPGRERASVLSSRICKEFNGEGELHLPPHSKSVCNADLVASVENGAEHQAQLRAGEGEDIEVSVLAIMNAFHAEEIRRVVDLSVEAGWTSPSARGREILYLTGAARPYGLEATAAEGMTALCVGHVACEKWGIRYLAERIREEYPGLDVHEIYEEETEKAGQ